MEQEATFGLFALGGVLVGGVLLYGLLVRAVYPLRVTLFERAQILLEQKDCTKEDRLFINYVLDTALSFKAGWSVSHAVWRTVLKKAAGDVSPPSRTAERVVWIMPRYFVSVLVANPFALACTLIALPFLFFTAKVREHEKFKDAFRDATREVKPRRLRKYAY